MIYGNKFLNIQSTNYLFNVLNDDALNIDNLLKECDLNLLNEAVTNAKLSFGDIVKKIVGKIIEFITIILDKLSSLIKKAIPKLYEAVQKMIAKIRKNNINYQGIKEIELIEIKPDVLKEIERFSEVFNVDGGYLSSYIMTHKEFNSKLLEFIEDYSNATSRFALSYEKDKDQAIKLHNIIVNYNNTVAEINDKLRANFDGYFKFYKDEAIKKDFNINKFFKKETIKLESEKDYNDILKYLDKELNSSKGATSSITTSITEITALSKRLQKAADDIFKEDNTLAKKAKEFFGTSDNYFTYIKNNNLPNNDNSARKYAYEFIRREKFKDMELIDDKNVRSTPIGYYADNIPLIGKSIFKIHLARIKYIIQAYNQVSLATLKEPMELDEVKKTINDIMDNQ